MKKILTLLILLGGAAAGLVVWQPWADEAPTGPGDDFRGPDGDLDMGDIRDCISELSLNDDQ